MVNEIARNQFLANPREFVGAPCLGVAIVGGGNAEEPAVLESWALLKERLNGTGTRHGYRAFLVLVQDSEADLRTVVATFSGQDTAHASWRFVAARIEKPEDCLSVLQEIEWRAHKAVQYQGEPLQVIGTASAL